MSTAQTLLKSGTFNGPGTSTLTGTVQLDGGAAITLDGGAVLDNTGTFTMGVPSEVDAGGAVITQSAGGSITSGDNNGSNTLTNSQGATIETIGGTADSAVVIFPNIFNNQGALMVTADPHSGSGETIISAKLNNTGTIEIDAGALLSIGGGGTSSASAFTVAAGGTLEIGTDPFTFTGGTYDVAGDTIFTAGKIDMSAVSGITFTNLVSAATLTLGSQNVTIDAGSLKGSAMTGSGTISLTGPVDLSEASFIGGKVVIEQKATAANDEQTELFNGAVLQNNGTLTLGTLAQVNASGTVIVNGTGAQLVSGGGSGTNTLINSQGATIDLVGGWGQSGVGITTDILTNDGTIEATADPINPSGALYIASTLTNVGSIEVGAGATLQLRGTGTSNASAFTVAAGGTLEFSAFTWTGGTYDVAGTTLLNNNQTLQISGSVTLDSALGGSGTLGIDANSTLDLNAALGSNDSITFLGSAAKLIIETPSSFNTTLYGYAVGDMIDLHGLSASSVAVSGAKATVTTGSGSFLFTLGGTITATWGFTIASDGAGGSLLTFIDGSSPAYQATQSFGGGTLTDTAANISLFLDGLEKIAASGSLTGITLSDSGIPTLSLSASQVSNDAAAIKAIDGYFAVTQAAPTTSATLTGPANALGNTVTFKGEASDYTISSNHNGSFTVTGDGVTDTLSDVQALSFSDHTLIVASTPGTSQITTGNITELYGAVFGRLPDVAGLAYYQDELAANPAMPLTAFAQAFLSSPEYVNNAAHDYAANSSGDAQFITDSYTNLLHRAPEAGAVDWYEQNVIAPNLQGLVPGTAAYTSALLAAHAAVLADFSQSGEFLNDVQVTAAHPADATHWLVLI